MNDLTRLQDALSEFEAPDLSLDGARRAAVAAILRERGEAIELLFIRRADHPLDPWSGHMAFPGGRVDDQDRDGFEAAHRETLEETGIDLRSSARYLGRLSDLQASGRGKKLPLVIEPHVFELQGDVELSLDESEVQEALFIPLAHLLDRSNRGMLRWRKIVPLPSIRFEGREIWGLTLKMTDELLGFFQKPTDS